MATPYAFVTLLTSDTYLPGALTLAAALKEVHPRPLSPPEVEYKTVCLVTPESVDVSTIKLLRRAFDEVIGVEILEQDNEHGLKLLGRPDLNTVLTKLHIFRLIQFSKIIFLDADVLPIRPLSHLFSNPHEFSAVPDVGWPDIFNSGVLVLSPGEENFAELVELLKQRGSWDGGDQGILNEWRGGNWHRLSFTYNTTPTAAYTYAPAYERFGSKINAIHFIGPNKPWKSIEYRAPFSQASSSKDTAYHYNSLVDRWFSVYDNYYRSEPITDTLQNEFRFEKYTSVWNDTQKDSTTGLGLDDLKRLAIEGYGTSGFSKKEHPGVGVYKTLPLEGRITLRRHKISRFSDEISFDAAASPSGEMKVNLPPPPSQWRSHTLPTPYPHEVPAGPHPQTIPLPATSTPYSPTAPFTPGSHSRFVYDPPLYAEQASLLPSRPYTPSTSGGNSRYTPRSQDYFPTLWGKDVYERAQVRQLMPGETAESQLLFRSHAPTSTVHHMNGAQPPNPDRSVKTLFPWEENPRHVVGRVFPGDAMPLVPPVQPHTPERREPRSQQLLSPLNNNGNTLSYSNAWDTVPSIKKYATKLASSPTKKTQSLAPAFDGGKLRKADKYKDWDERVEQDSRDGDVEDEVDEDDRGQLEIVELSLKPLEQAPTNINSEESLSRKMQTEERLVHNQATQAEVPGLPLSPPENLPKGSGATSESGSHTYQSRSVTSLAGSAPIASGDSPSPLSSHSKQKHSKKSGSNGYFAQQMSNDSSAGSPSSSVGPHSPPDSQLISSSLRRGGRVWDPARGVEVFKRGSEEVLARFLKMSTWDDTKGSGATALANAT